jgi:hypothetical protein
MSTRRKGTVGKRKGSSPRRGNRAGTWAVIGLVVLLLLMVAIRMTTSARVASKNTSLLGRPISPALAASLQRASEAAYAARAGAQAPMLVKASNPLWTQSGLPVVFYAGGNYCPFCAAERWILVLTMDRFGTFHNLRYMRSTLQDRYPGTATFSFHGSSYQSPYVVFKPVEMYGDNPVNGTFPPLETPTATELKLLTTYDAPPYAQAAGQIPFVDVGNRYFWSGAAYDPGLLAGKNWTQIARVLAGPKTNALTQAVWANVNALTAAVCVVDREQPTSVCNRPSVRAYASFFAR